MKRTPPTPNLSAYHVWVLAPELETNDPNLSHYYDFTHSIKEYKIVFEELGIGWTWTPVNIKNVRSTIAQIAKSNIKTRPLVLNLCDVDEVNGAPGLSVIDALQEEGLVYTGSDQHFYSITTSKIPMKRAFDKAGVSTAPWKLISGRPSTLKGVCEQIGTPLIIKPAVSGGSMGVSVKNVVNSEEELFLRVKELASGYRGWNLLADGLFVEKYIKGPEFTTFITGSSDQPDGCFVYEPVERLFHPSLPDNERFLSFDRLWEIYEDESPMPQNENFYEYGPVSAALRKKLQQLSLEAYAALGGRGYTRIDIRQDAETGLLYVLEANAQCGLSEDEDYTSIGAIIKASKVSYTKIIEAILLDAIRRAEKPQMAKIKKAKAV
jgi:D-alanine-D-alanine ligase